MEPYFRTRKGILYKGDAWKILKEIESKSVDLVILDPPYVETRDVRVKSNEWSLNKNWGVLFKQINRVLKDNGVVFLFGLPSYYILVAEYIAKYFRVYFDMIWFKSDPIGFINCKRRPLQQHEQILCLIKHDAKVTEITYNYKAIAGKGKSYKRIRKNEYCPYANANYVDTINEGIKYPTTVVVAPNKPAMKRDERTPHPTQKPLELIEYLVKGWTNENDLVLDTFCGSGTTAVVCEKLNRRWICIEIDEKWCNLTKERVIKVTKQFSIKKFLTNHDTISP